MCCGGIMTDALLALVPTYGVWLVLVALPLSCLALPVPSSILLMAAGSFASAGDLVLWQVQAAAFAGFVLGDQLTYGVARVAGPRVVAAMIGNAIGVVLAGAVVVVLGVYLWRAWQVEKARAPV
jgi:membrane-associated protein